MFRSRPYYYVDEDGIPVSRAPVVVDRDLRRQRAVARVSAALGFVFSIIYAIIGTRILLEALGAREGNSFKEFVDRISGPLLVWFDGLLPSIFIGRFELALSFVFALIVYAIIHYGIRRLLWSLARPRAY